MDAPSWLRTGWATHRGRRPVNEDAVLVDGPLLAVADGVGGAPRGDLASLEAVGAVREVIDEPDGEPAVAAVVSELSAALTVADESVKHLADRWRELRGTATTMCAAMVFIDGQGALRAVVANVGDSRCYQVRGDRADQITADQTLGAQLRQAGVDDVSDRADNIVVSILGGQPDSQPDIDLYRLALEPGDGLLLCTDGVSGALDAEQLADIGHHRYPGRPDQGAAALVRAAYDAGATDNLTAALAVVTASEMGPW